MVRTGVTQCYWVICSRSEIYRPRNSRWRGAQSSAPLPLSPTSPVVPVGSEELRAAHGHPLLPAAAASNFTGLIGHLHLGTSSSV